MKLKEIADALKAKFVCCPDMADIEIKSACGCDIMSDVLAFVKDQGVLLTGLCNPQVVRTVIMLDMKAIVFVRGKQPDENTVALAARYGIPLLTTEHSMFVACGLLFAQGLSGGNAAK